MATYTVTDLNDETEIQDIFDAAQSDGDRVVFPAGTGTWTSALTWNAPPNAVLIGGGTSATGGGDVTIIIDGYNSTGVLLTVGVSPTGVFRMTGFTIRVTMYEPTKENGHIRIEGPGEVRIDHMHLDNHTVNGIGNAKPLVIGNLVYGVLDSSIIDTYGNSAIYVLNGAGVDGKGNQTWADPTNFGSSNFFFIEDNLFRATVAYPIRLADGWSAARVVWRFNTIVGGAGFEVHATGHGGDDRGVRASEGYGNYFSVLTDRVTPAYDMADCSSGAMLLWGNEAEWTSIKNVFLFNVTRKDNTTYSQSATPAGWGYAGTNFNGTGSNWDGGTINATDTATGYPCVDQPGRGQGQLLVGSFSTKTNNVTGTIAWPNQVLEPIYFFKNSAAAFDGGNYFSDSSGGRVVADRDYYAQASGVQTSPTSPFNGTTGTGWGTIANRPTTCTVGVAYWATDEGSWNTSSSNPYGVQQNGASGKMYVCLATNVWTARYGAAVTSGTDGEPFTYPHPARIGSGAILEVTTMNVGVVNGPA